ncbi:MULTISPECIES: winged helix-turn-helix transcriptional regulator [Spirosoma]|uniref:Helix-turn-helix transcriptional regulator n=1 Tax=Spirosoma liriopis TaxID=2937440 RepID=A0ABT0HMF1_9BACT|nr:MULTISPECIES: helix-turn-helix domain-containing protein [Spirosoma]MCK8493349.1 helix-turn-helix transcriptional regulator [Spirosoma liriopis]UHG92737.1 helix-turn-helix transcriptional regulator [Spirosoma oryzicola]
MNRTIADNQQDIVQEKLQKILGPVGGSIANCPIRNILDRFSDKWSTLSIFHLGNAGTLRFNELKKRIDGVSQRMLTVTLRTLERDGLVSRRVYPEIPPRVEYELTDLGKSFLVQIIELGDWASNHSAQIIQAREQYAARERVPVA